MNSPARIPASAFALVALIAAVPAAAHANVLAGGYAGGVLYLVLASMLIAALEAAILRFAFGLPFGRAMAAMAAANIVSSTAGAFLMWDPGWLLHDLVPISPRIPAAAAVVAATLAIASAATLLIEYPFVHIAAPKEKRSWMSSAVRCLAIHAVTIPMLVAFHAFGGGIGLATATTIRASAAEFAKPPIGTVFFVRDGELRSIRTDGTGEHAVPVEDPRPVDPDDLAWHALIPAERLPQGEPFDAEIWRLGSKPARLAGPFHGWLPWNLDGVGDQQALGPGHWRGTGSDWRGRTGHLDSRGQQAGMEYDRIQIPPYRRPGPHRVLGMSAPGFSGMMRQQAHLPSGQILFEVDGEIYLLDPETLELAFLARGRAAVSFFTPEDFAEGGVPEHAVGFYGAPIVLPAGAAAEETPAEAAPPPP